MSIETTTSVEVTPSSVETTVENAGDLMVSTQHEVCVQPAEELIEVVKKEYSIVGDGLFASVSTEEAPAWLTDIIDSIVDSALLSGFSDYDQLRQDVLSAIDSIDLANNNYVSTIIMNQTIDSVIIAKIDQLNANLDDKFATITKVDLVSVNASNALALSIESVKAEFTEEINARVDEISLAFANADSAIALNITSIESVFGYHAEDILATAGAVTGLQTYVGLDSSNIPNGTGIDATLVTHSQAFTNLANVLSGAPTTASSLVSLRLDSQAYTDGSTTAVENKFSYDSELILGGLYYKSGFGLDASGITQTTDGLTPATAFDSEFWVNAERFVLKSPSFPGVSASFEVTASGIQLSVNHTEATRNNPKGAYNALTTYVSGDLVSYNGSSYVSLVNQTGVTPVDDDINWQLLSAIGNTGIKGDPGSSGTDGTSGTSSRLDIAYSDNDNGIGNLQLPNGLLSTTYTTASSLASNNYIGTNVVTWDSAGSETVVSTLTGDYEWTEMTGPAGANGISNRVDIAYSTLAAGGGTVNFPTGKLSTTYTAATPGAGALYIGTNVVTWISSETEPAVSSVVGDYEWSKFVGDDGATGERGTATLVYAADLGAIATGAVTSGSIAGYWNTVASAALSVEKEGDVLIVTNTSSADGWTHIYEYNGTSWASATAFVVNGNQVVTGTLSAGAIGTGLLLSTSIAGDGDPQFTLDMEGKASFRNIEIKDDAGNVIMNSGGLGGVIPSGNLNSTDLLNANTTATDVGLGNVTDGADVTGSNTALNTVNVSGNLASDVASWAGIGYDLTQDNATELHSSSLTITPTNVSTFISAAAIDTAYIANAAITNALIGNLAVDTVQIADNAVTVPEGFVGTDATLSGGGTAILAVGTANPLNGKVSAVFTANITGLGDFRGSVEIMVDGVSETTIFGFASTATLTSFRIPLSFNLITSSFTGSKTFTVTATHTLYGSFTVSDCLLTLTGMKK